MIKLTAAKPDGRMKGTDMTNSETRDDQAVRRLEADVQMLQAQIGAMEASVMTFGEQLQKLTNLTVELSEHVTTLAVQLAEARL